VRNSPTVEEPAACHSPQREPRLSRFEAPGEVPGTLIDCGRLCAREVPYSCRQLFAKAASPRSGGAKVLRPTVGSTGAYIVQGWDESTCRTILSVSSFLAERTNMIRRLRQSLAAAIRARSEQSVLSFSSNRFLISELLLGKLSETVVVHGNAPHDRPRSLVSHLPLHESAKAQGPRQTFWMAFPRPSRGWSPSLAAHRINARLAGHGADGFYLPPTSRAEADHID
jgi:hypothetical protein